MGERHETLAPAPAGGRRPRLGLWRDRELAGTTIDLTEGSLQDRILTATLRCLGRWGTVKTTIDDIAREAGCSRATVYRTFPGGKDALFLAAGERELLLALGELASLAAEAVTLDELLGTVLAAGVSTIRTHKVLAYLCEHEPGVILPYVSFDGMDPVLGVVRGVLAPHLERFLDRTAAADIAEWLARVGMAYGFDPLDGPDLADPDEAHRFVATFVLPGLEPCSDTLASASDNLASASDNLASASDNLAPASNNLAPASNN
ncbi:MAG: TetR/AcrR family transcriptional regulator [Actinobacteria bacterium]|nr:TetR/AcrR family transcriptional regulator [Actinomycetota bacterium]